jgi:hypothetical protein
MSANLFYELWVSALHDLALAKEDAERQRERADSKERESALLQLLLRDLKRRQTTRKL